MADGDVVKTTNIIMVKDTGGQLSRISFGEDATVTLAKAFLSTYCSNTIYGASKVEELACAKVEGTGDEEDNVDKKVIMSAKDSVTGLKLRFVVPGYKGFVFIQGEKGTRVDDTTGQACCDAWKTANALPNALTFLRGTPVQRA